MLGCDRHVFQVIPRFKVRIEVTDGQATGVFVLFNYDTSYMMEKSCAFFVAQSKAKNSGVFFTSSKATSNVVELDSDGSSDDSGGGDDLHAD
ncbi:hypothetical protein P8452_18400 [Trifolium repens]|nr:hypothetical protein P8452_18400 [Trifolium repens]